MTPHALLFSSNAQPEIRNPGVHRVATVLREHGWSIEVGDFAPWWPRPELEEYVLSRVTAHTKFFGFGTFFDYWPQSMDDLGA